MNRRALYHKATALYEPGDRIPPGNWGRVTLGKGPLQHPNFFLEYVFERVRQTEFPEKPSRMRSAFVCETHTGTDKLNTEGLIYLVELEVPDVTVHRGDLTWPSVLWGYHTFDGIDNCARQYWESRERTPDAWELVGESALIVVDRITPIGENGTGGTQT